MMEGGSGAFYSRSESSNTSDAGAKSLYSMSRLDRGPSIMSSQRLPAMFARKGSSSHRSSTGSVFGVSKETAALIATFAPYDLEGSKTKVMKRLEDQLCTRLKNFYGLNNSLYDKLVIACLQYMTALIYVQGLKQAFLKAQRQKHERLKPDVVEERLDDLQKWMTHSCAVIAPIYANVVASCSKSSQPHNDQLFFEGLYLATAEVIIEVLGPKHAQQINLEIGRIFRTPAFNSFTRTMLGPRSRDTVTISELHALTEETLPANLDHKLISCLREGPDIRPHHQKDRGSTILHPHLMERKQVVDITDPSLDITTRKPPANLNEMFYQRKVAQKVKEEEAELASYTVHVTDIGMVETEITLKMSHLQKQMLQANHRF